MQIPFVTHPKSGEPDPMLTASVIAIFACVVRFMLDDVTLKIAGHILTIGHMDPFAYSSLLAPILGTHGYIHTRAGNSSRPPITGKVDNPDGN